MVWEVPENANLIASPGLLIDPDRVAGNIQIMLKMVGGDAARLRPHVKTHKMPHLVSLQVAAGIRKFKTATIAEADMVAGAGGHDVLLAYQPVGPNIARLGKLIDKYPNTKFSTVVDDLGIAKALGDELGDSNRPLQIFIDVDCGMHRTGIALGSEMETLRDFIESHAGLQFAGLHVYDGHIHDAELASRNSKAQQVLDAIGRYQQMRPAPSIIGGGSPTFTNWSSETSWECSPGTPLLWDIGYGTPHPEYEFSVAAVLLTRVISKPGTGRVCFDLGYKAVASEMPLAERVYLNRPTDAVLVGQSEEHLVVETAQAAKLDIGEPVLAFPKHICPTVALHAFATIIRNNAATGETWPITARDR